MKRNKGLGRVYQPSWRDRKTGELRYSPTWWIALGHRGRRIQVSSNSTKRADALRLLKHKLAELGAGRPVGPDVDRTTFEDLAAILENDYKANGRRSIRLLKGKLNNLRELFGMELAADITSDRVTAFIAYRLGQGVKNATVNNELRLLKRAFHLAHEARRVASIPVIRLLHEANARKGFFEEEQFRAVVRHLPDDLKPVVHIAYLTGWRVDSEILTRKRSHVDLNAGWLRLEPGESKNQQGRMFPVTPELRTVLEAQVARTRALERETGRIVPWLFHREGKQIKNFRRAWLTACKLAGVPGKLRHDFRRTAVRNLERAGVSRSAAMAMVGHKTQAIYSRYAIVSEGDLKEAAVKLATLHGQMSAERTERSSTFAKAQLKQASNLEPRMEEK